MTTNTRQLAALLEQAANALMSAECHQWLSDARKDISTARTALTRALSHLNTLPVAAELVASNCAFGKLPEYSGEERTCYPLNATATVQLEDGSVLSTIDWNEISRRGLLERINREIMQPAGLAAFRVVETGVSPGAQVLTAQPAQGGE